MKSFSLLNIIYTKSSKYIFFTILLLLFVVKKNDAQNKPRIFVNEFLASNLSTNQDMVDFGDFSDWIELYNDESVDINIGGYYLTDDFSDSTKWQIPQSAVIPAKGFYLIWADGYNDIPGKNYIRDWWPHDIPYTTKWCHTNFKLDKDKDKIGLFDSNGDKIDSVSFSNQVADVSYGRQPDGSNNWFYFGEPTPMKPNIGSALNKIEYSGDVIFSVEGGFFSSAVRVSLSSSTDSGIIRYTTDGSKPVSSSSLYSSLIEINSNTVLRARVFENSKVPGRIITNSYFFNESRNLPAVSMVTDPKFLWDKNLGIYLNTYKDRQIPVSLEYFPLNSGRAFFLDAGARIGGENIYRFAEKPINIYSSNDYGYPHISYNIFDDLPFNEYSRLYLRNGGDDWPYTMFRDGLQVNVLKNRIENSMQDFKPSVLYLNGQYWGIYNLREKIDEQYFLLHYNVDPSNLDHLEYDNTVISGDPTDFVNLLSFAKVNSLSHQSNYDYVAARIDIHNLMDFIIASDYFANSSWGHNREVWRDNKNEKLWRWILVDMDRGFDANRISVNQFDDIFTNFELFQELLTNENFKNEFVQRYAERLNHTFNTSREIALIDSLKSIIENEMPRHIEKWGTYIDSLSIDIWGKTPGIQSMTAWNSEVEKLKKFASERASYVSEYLAAKLNLEGRATLTIDSNFPEKGKITVNDFLGNFGEKNLYFKNIPLEVTAYPPPGYKFKQWDEKGSSTNLNIIQAGSLWKYRDENSAPNNSWKNIGFDDSNWKSGNAQFGYGDGDENTVINYGSDSQNKFITSYYRYAFQVDDPGIVTELNLQLLRDDGAIVYLNGNEIVRSNMPSGTVTYSMLATTAVGDPEETTFFEFTITNPNLVKGENVIAVEIHQANQTSSDISFDLSLSATLNQPSDIESVIGTNPTIIYTLTGDAQLIVEFEKAESTEISKVIDTPVTLTRSDSPYYITEDVTVEKSGVLVIESGTEIFFSSGKSLYVKGALQINGTELEPVTLTSYFQNEKWGAICFDHASGISELNYVNVSNASNGNDTTYFFAAVSSLNSSVSLKNVSFDKVKLPVSSQYSIMTIDNCRFKNVLEIGDYINCNGGNLTVENSLFAGNNFADMDAIDLGFMTGTAEIKNNTIEDFTGGNSDGIDLGDGCSNVVIENNLIKNCHDKGVSVGQGSNAVLIKNIIAGCADGVGIKDSLSFADIRNCTFYSNNIGVACFEKSDNRGGGSAKIINSLFANSSEASFTIDDYSNISMSYSISDKDSLPGIGNIKKKAYMVNPKDGNYKLRVDSPCIDAGDPASPKDDDGTRADIGAFAFAGLAAPDIVINEINYNSSSDFDSDDWIELYNKADKEIDLSGWVFIDENESPSFIFGPGTVLQSHSYLVVCKSQKAFTSLYASVNNYVGNMEDGLSGSGEAIALYNNSGKLVDSLRYNDKSPWAIEADGTGSSLELENPSFDNALAGNWKASIGHGTPGKINSTFVTAVNKHTEKTVPENFSLMQNFPNPFNPLTNIRFEIPEQSFVQVIIFNVIGQEVAKITEGKFEPGTYSFKWDGSSFTSGIYFIKMDAQANEDGKNFTAVKKMILLK